MDNLRRHIRDTNISYQFDFGFNKILRFCSAAYLFSKVIDKGCYHIWSVRLQLAFIIKQINKIL